MNTSNYPDQVSLWRVFRYLALQLGLGVFKFGWWLVSRSLMFVLGFLRLMASPASSGRAQDEFKDLVQPDYPDGQAPRADGSDGFWRMYLQAYSPRLWRMRRLLPMSAGKDLKGRDQEDDD